MKNLFLIFLAGIFLGGCGDTTDKNAADTPQKNFFFIEKSPFFKIQIPENWKEVSPAEFLGKDFSGTIVGAFRALESQKNVFPTLVITTEKIPKNISALEFSENLMFTHADRLFSFEKKDETPIEIAGQKTKLLEFSGATASDKPPKNFWQVAIVRDGRAVIATGVAAIDDNFSPPIIKNILKTLSFGDVAKR